MGKNRNVNDHSLRLTAIFFLVAVVFIALSIFYYRYEAKLIEDDKYEDISVISKLKADAIQDWRKQRLADVQRVAVGPLVRKEIARLLHDPMNPDARAALHIQLNINKKNTVYADALFLDTKGKILLSENPDPSPVDQTTTTAIGIALKDLKASLSDLFRDPKGHIYIDAVSPILDNSGQPMAIVVLRSKADDYLFPLIQMWPASSKTAETLLFRRDGDSILFLNELRHRSNTALNLRFSITNKTLPAVQIISGKYNRLYGKDYRGVDVLAIGEPIPQSPWFIVSKVDTQEILTELRYRAWVITIIAALLILISAGLISLIYRNQQEIERRRTADMLRQQTDAMDSAIDGMAILDAKGEYIYLNKAHVRIYGYENEGELIGKSWRVLYEPDVIQRFDEEYMPEFSRKGYWFGESIGKKKDGSMFPQAVSLTAMANGGLICVVRDITKRKLAEEKLHHTLDSLRKAIGATIQVMVSTVEIRDPYTAGHQLRVADLACAIAAEMGLSADEIEGIRMAGAIHDIGKLSIPAEMGLSADEIEGIRMAGAIHDIGKLSIPAEILVKPTKLTKIEFLLIKEHSQTGYDMLKNIESPWPLAQIVYQHHERIDGSGYPGNLKGDEILMEARIMAVADVVEAMASHRPYRAALGIEIALEEIEKNKGILYDNAVADACLKLFKEKGYKLLA